MVLGDDQLLRQLLVNSSENDNQDRVDNGWDVLDSNRQWLSTLSFFFTDSVIDILKDALSANNDRHEDQTDRHTQKHLPGIGVTH